MLTFHQIVPELLAIFFLVELFDFVELHEKKRVSTGDTGITGSEQKSNMFGLKL
jgi:hypothetical protein